MIQMCCMTNGSAHLSTWVTEETKQRFALLAQQLGLSESALLKRSVNLMLQSTDANASALVHAPVKVPRDLRLCVRLRPQEHRLLKERARSRGIPAATYASLLLRSHLSGAAPLPDRELNELKHSVAALSLIGRNLNQIARLANQGGQLNGPSTAELLALLRALGACRDHFKALLKANSQSWETGHDETNG